ncbi:hypothetical protein [Microbacterium schleiferi]|uniref:DUF4245 domain-containing protein n=1 Tax=Microbacterium schleiferi TaxID=69362 RepID=A0ABU7V538_9MICO
MNETAQAPLTRRNTASSRRSPTPWWVWTLAAIGGVGLVAFVTVIGVITVPPAIANLQTHVATATEPLVLGPESAPVIVTVPEGWLITRPDDSHARIVTPDRGLIVDASLSAADAAQAATDAGVAAPMVETLASGLTVAHGSPSGSSEGAAAGPDLVAVVGPVAGGSVVFVASSGDLERYRAAMASLVEGVQP